MTLPPADAQRPPTAAPPPRRGLLHLAVRSALLDLYPAVDPLPGLAAAEVDTFLARLRAEATAMTWWALAIAGLAYQLAPILTLGLPVPAAWLGDDLRDRHADRASRSRFYLLQQATFLLKTFGGAAWGAKPEVRALLAPERGSAA